MPLPTAENCSWATNKNVSDQGLRRVDDFDSGYALNGFYVAEVTLYHQKHQKGGARAIVTSIGYMPHPSM